MFVRYIQSTGHVEHGTRYAVRSTVQYGVHQLSHQASQQTESLRDGGCTVWYCTVLYGTVLSTVRTECHTSWLIGRLRPLPSATQRSLAADFILVLKKTRLAYPGKEKRVVVPSGTVQYRISTSGRRSRDSFLLIRMPSIIALEDPMEDGAHMSSSTSSYTTFDGILEVERHERQCRGPADVACRLPPCVMWLDSEWRLLPIDQGSRGCSWGKRHCGCASEGHAICS